MFLSEWLLNVAMIIYMIVLILVLLDVPIGVRKKNVQIRHGHEVLILVLLDVPIGANYHISIINCSNGS